MSLFSKLGGPYRSTQYLNTANANDATIGGQITNSPSGYQGSQLQQNFPGDRFIFGAQDAFAASNNAVGNLFMGSYRCVQFRNNSTANVKLGRGVFWDPTSGNNFTGNNISNNWNADTPPNLMVTADGNSANYTQSLFAGVAINNITLASTRNWFWFIQEAGKASCQFRSVISGTPAIGAGVYLPLTAPANNNATDNGAFDQLVGANSAAIFTANSTTGYTTVDEMITNYVGVAETLPSNNNIAIVDMTMQRASFRITGAI